MNSKTLLAAAVLGSLAAPAFAVTGSATAGLIAMRQTNLIVLGNWTTGHDVEGKTFVGGTASGNSASLGNGNASQGADASGRRTLTIVGNNNVNNFNINNGSNGGSGKVATTPGVAIGGNSAGFNLNAGGSAVDIGGNFSGNVNVASGQTVNIGGNATGSINGTSGATVNAGGSINGNANGAAFNRNLGIGWNSAFVTGLQSQAAQLDADLTALSAKLGSLSLATNPSTITTLGGRAIFNAVDNGAGFALFNVDSNFFSTHTEVQYNFGSSTLPVFINVSGATITYNLNAIAGNNLGNRQVIWNFIDATVVTLNRMVNGSVLATKATLSNVTPIEGSVVARNFNQGGEVHLGTYGADPDILPEPGTWLQMIAGFGLVGGFARRRRRVVA